MNFTDSLQTAVFKTSRSFGGIVAQVVFEEQHSDDTVITDHPVEQGANITDHSFFRPAEVTIRMGWNNAGLAADFQAASDLINGPSGFAGSNGNTQLQTFYNQLLGLRGTRVPFDIITAKRYYTNMLISNLSTVTDEKTANILMITARCRQVIIVQTMAVTIAPAADMASPELTAPTIPVGGQSLKPASGFNTQGYDSGVGKSLMIRGY